MTNIETLIREISTNFRLAGIDDPVREAKSIIAAALQKESSFLVAHPEYIPTQAESAIVEAFASRRSNREPFSQIVGSREFYNLDFVVSRDVLTPRPETELVVERAINVISSKQLSDFCDVGIGSGCISIAVLKNLPNVHATGLEISESAIKIAQENARRHEVEHRFEIVQSDLFESVGDRRFDLVVSNPPYIAIADLKTLEPEVTEYEPFTALTDGGTGLSFIEKIITTAPKYLHRSGVLILEIGHDQAVPVTEMFDQRVWTDVQIDRDLQGHPRVVSSVLR